ncbi:hypothetical protein SCHPADRAFT_828865 [Schizopora paradoxa]|uniref:HSF-type DNA-binding domain-containing protein n=1 Tax=Schizopora paradoxa TaxID=27342 RepID=A0A0H2S7H0_9AGAM|nr:hypothetical protein SCHPADRAFT_828865 [Schizopora paradoxa]
MIRWDAAGDHIIVERPEQLALHVLPSVYRQSRFASFSRQLNIYGFMRKVNLRNVDPAIDDPDASTWSHPTLNRHSPQEVVANFKRRVPPRLPKPRKRQDADMQQIPPPRSAIGMAPVPLTVPSTLPGSPGSKARARGFSAPGSFTPLGQGSWGHPYPRSALPPLTVPSDTGSMNHSMYGSHSAHPGLHPISPADDVNSSFNSAYSGSHMTTGQYPYSTSAASESNTWAFSPVSAGGSTSSGHSGSLSSLLNPSGNQYTRGTLAAASAYASPYGSMPAQGNHSTSSLSPDSRPTTGYSVSSMSSLPYETEGTSVHHGGSEYNSRPNSSHYRASSPPRPHSSHHNAAGSAVRRVRRHSQAVSPYPSPYDDHGMDHSGGMGSHHQRPSTSPQPAGGDGSHGGHHAHGMSRVRSMVQIGNGGSSQHHPADSSSAYTFNPAQGDFAYTTTCRQQLDSMDGWGSARNVRPSTSTSTMSNSSQANTPPVDGGYGGAAAGGDEINRFSPDFGFVPLNEGIPNYAKAHQQTELMV